MPGPPGTTAAEAFFQAITFLVTLDLAGLAGPVMLRWFDPSSGAYRPVEGSPFPNAGRRDFDPPGRNAAGDPDFLLLAESR